MKEKFILIYKIYTPNIEGQKLTKTLLSRLVKYSQKPEKESFENFVTEVIGYLFERDIVFREVFLKFILKDNKIKQKEVKRWSSKTQERYPIKNTYCIVDLVLENKYENKKLLIEIKTSSEESEDQINKYISLKEGNVAYLTNYSILDPDIKSEEGYLDHYYFEDLYRLLMKRKLITEVGEIFKEFMEEKNMVPAQPFTSEELKKLKLAFKIIAKFETILPVVADKHMRAYIQKKLGVSKAFHQYFIVAKEETIYKRMPVSGLPPIEYIDIEFWLDENNILSYGTSITGGNKKWDKLLKLNKYLKWIEHEEKEKALHTSYEIKKGNLKIKEIIGNLENDIDVLKKALEKYKKSKKRRKK